MTQYAIDGRLTQRSSAGVDRVGPRAVGVIQRPGQVVALAAELEDWRGSSLAILAVGIGAAWAICLAFLASYVVFA